MNPQEMGNVIYNLGIIQISPSFSCLKLSFLEVLQTLSKLKVQCFSTNQLCSLPFTHTHTLLHFQSGDFSSFSEDIPTTITSLAPACLLMPLSSFCLQNPVLPRSL